MEHTTLRLPCGARVTLDDAGVFLFFPMRHDGCLLDWASVGVLAALGEREEIHDPVLRKLAAQEHARALMHEGGLD